MKINLPILQRQDKIIVLATSGKIKPDYIRGAENTLKEYGFRVEVKASALSEEFYFAGTQKQRLEDLQSAFDDVDCKAILCARGGYGAVQLVEKLNLDGFCASPKWLIGFSDITVLHSLINKVGIASIHGGMTKEFAENSQNAKDVTAILNGEKKLLQWSSNYGVEGEVIGVLMGGNLSIIVSLLATNFVSDYDGAILFLEDVGESAYKIERLFYTLKLSGVLARVSGIIVGQLTGVDDDVKTFGKPIQEVILNVVKPYSIPIAFGLQSGHEGINRPLILGEKVALFVDDKNVKLSYLDDE